MEKYNQNLAKVLGFNAPKFQKITLEDILPSFLESNLLDIIDNLNKYQFI